MTEKVEVHPTSHPTNCPYCHGALGADEAVWRCPRCTTAHHADCARTNARCTILGCGALYDRHRVEAGQPRSVGRGTLWAILAGVFAIVVWSSIALARAMVASFDARAHAVQAPQAASPHEATTKSVDMFDDIVSEAAADAEDRELRIRTNHVVDRADILARPRMVPGLRALIHGQLAEGDDPVRLQARVRYALGMRGVSADTINAVLRDAFDHP